MDWTSVPPCDTAALTASLFAVLNTQAYFVGLEMGHVPGVLGGGGLPYTSAEALGAGVRSDPLSPPALRGTGGSGSGGSGSSGTDSASALTGGLGFGAVIGIALGGGAGLLLACLCCYRFCAACCVKRRVRPSRVRGDHPLSKASEAEGGEGGGGGEGGATTTLDGPSWRKKSGARGTGTLWGGGGSAATGITISRSRSKKK